MKRAIHCMLGLLVLTGTTFAQVTDNSATGTAGSGRTDSTTTTATTHDATQSTKFCRSKDLVGANIKDSAGQKLGSIDELLINPQTGETLASVGISGGRYALVPVQAFNMTRAGGMLRNAELTLNTTKDAFQSAPALAKHEWQKLDDQTFTKSIYTHFNVQAPSAMGGSESGSLEGKSTGFGSTTKTNTPIVPKRY